ncbi:hypothetical protein SUGI_1137670 [Cryptomeria japonica]|nr:hypothetical protein SUGI_1137670 [Cryptomeria japonica]
MIKRQSSKMLKDRWWFSWFSLFCLIFWGTQISRTVNPVTSLSVKNVSSLIQTQIGYMGRQDSKVHLHRCQSVVH